MGDAGRHLLPHGRVARHGSAEGQRCPRSVSTKLMGQSIIAGRRRPLPARDTPPPARDGHRPIEARGGVSSRPRRRASRTAPRPSGSGTGDGERGRRGRPGRPPDEGDAGGADDGDAGAAGGRARRLRSSTRCCRRLRGHLGIRSGELVALARERGLTAPAGDPAARGPEWAALLEALAGVTPLPAAGPAVELLPLVRDLIDLAEGSSRRSPGGSGCSAAAARARPTRPPRRCCARCAPWPTASSCRRSWCGR